MYLSSYKTDEFSTGSLKKQCATFQEKKKWTFKICNEKRQPN